MPVQQFEQKVCQTTCPYCGVGCGVDATIVNGQLTAVSGSVQHQANFGKLCVKGSNLAETTDLDGRLLYPEVNGQRASWDDATDVVANKFKQVIAEHGPQAVAFYVSGQILTEDYYVANKLMKGYIGSANIDTNSRLCMSSAVAGYKRAFGSDTVPCSYEDLSSTDLLILVGSNAAWTHPILFQRMEQAKKDNPNMKVVVIDPRRSATAELADMFLPVKPGTDVALFMGMLNYIINNGGVDQDYVDQYCEGFDLTVESVSSWSVAKTATFCELQENDLELFFNAFCQSPTAVTFYSQGVNQSSQGVDKCNAIINCHLATGKLGKLGSGPFSITGQPNAMGGREVGGLANMLAAHMNIEDASHRDLVQSYWNSPVICNEHGPKAVEMFDKMAKGEIKAIWIMATNPMVSLPNRNEIEIALKTCEMVVVSDCMADTDTMDFADVKFPATTWAEKDGTVTNSERRISRQRGILAAPGESRHDWQIISDIAVKMGFEDAFNYKHPAEIFVEHAGLSGYKNGSDNYPVRDFDISGLATLSNADYDALLPVQWPVNATYPNGCQHIFADNRFYTPSGKANFIAVEAKLPKQKASESYPYGVNSGRVRDHWHTMTRTGKSASLAKHTKEPFIAMHSNDLTKEGLADGNLVKVTSEFGEVLLPVKVDDGLKIGQLFTPIHWNKLSAPTANIAKLYGSFVDPISGQPESKFTVANIEKAPVGQFMQLFNLEELNLAEMKLESDYWAKNTIQSGYEYACATTSKIDGPMFWSRDLTSIEGNWSYFENSQSGIATALCIRENRLVFVGFFAQYKPEINSDWVDSLFQQEEVTAEQINRVLRAAPGADFINGKTICSCFKVGENQIIDAIVSEGDNSVEKLGERLKCGTNCGSCKSELKTLIKQHGQPQITQSRFESEAIPVLEI